MASDPITWTDLKTVLADWLNRTDLTTQIPLFIAMAERKFNRVLRVPEMEDAQTASISAGTVTLPSDFLQLRSIYLDTDPKAILEQMSLAEFRNTYNTATTGKPQNFALQSGNEIVFGPSPDASYTVIINYYQAIPALGSGQATNWLLTAAPDIYIFGALLQAESYMVNDARIPLWALTLEGALEELRQQGVRKAYSAAPLRIRSPVVV